MQTQKTSPWLIAFRVIFTVALLWCIAYIFRNSLQTGAESSLRSQAVMRAVNDLLAHLRLGPLSEHTIRKLAHFLEFMLEGFLLMLCLRVYTHHFVRHMSWPLLAGMTIQLFTPNRTSMVTDVWLDMTGVVAGLFVALIILLIVRVCTAFVRIENENRALRAEHEQLRRAQQEQEHERLARRAAHRASQTGQHNAPAGAEEEPEQ